MRGGYLTGLKPGLRDIQDEPAEDTPERRAEYIDDHKQELVEWLRMGTRRSWMSLLNPAETFVLSAIKIG